MITWNITKLIMTTSIAILLLVISIPFFMNKTTGTVNKKVFSYIIFVFLITGQSTYLYQSITYYNDKYIEITKLKSSYIQIQLKQDIEKILQAGMSLNKLFNLEENLRSLSHSTEYIDNIIVTDSDRNTLYQAYSPEEPARYHTEIPILSNNLNAGYIRTHLSHKAITAAIFNLLLDGLTVLFISLVFITELLIFMAIFI